MKTTNKIICIFLLVLLSGCSLAQVDKKEKEEEKEDVFTGVMITNEQLHKQTSGKDIIYAEIKEDKKNNDFTFEFKNIEGLDMFNYCYPNFDKCEANFMTSSIGKEGLYNEQNNFKVADKGDELSIITNLYFNHTLKDKTFYINRIYETHDGKLFVSSGSGMGFAEPDTPGMVGSNVIEKSYESKDDNERNYKMKITIQFQLIHTPDYFNMIEMNENHQEIKTTTFNNNEIPDEFKPNMNTSYIIFEQISLDKENKIVKEIKSFNKKDKEIKAYTCRDDGICKVDPITLKW